MCWLTVRVRRRVPSSRRCEVHDEAESRFVSTRPEDPLNPRVCRSVGRFRHTFGVFVPDPRGRVETVRHDKRRRVGGTRKCFKVHIHRHTYTPTHLHTYNSSHDWLNVSLSRRGHAKHSRNASSSAPLLSRSRDRYTPKQHGAGASETFVHVCTRRRLSEIVRQKVQYSFLHHGRIMRRPRYQKRRRWCLKVGPSCTLETTGPT
ncbi:unnamed protein product [Protopolystoma xenopodis]|uniref:Uncharacterized protein n=1 Tax=Protopolystoma xenopodis TaxID=117903 RepID=A0A3S5A0L0_9PLAT|nr:unnamed protein product [Protopolystoma xenopodis]